MSSNSRVPDAAPPGLASPERAGEIARMKAFGLREFIELTGIHGKYGIYLVDRHGVAIDKVEAEAADAAAAVVLLAAEDHLNLKFPCSPEQFQDWFDATKGTNGVSDFPLAPGFLRALVEGNEAQRSRLGMAKPSSDIVLAFKVRKDHQDNRAWWDNRMRNPGKYGLESARASPGRAKKPSYWYPVEVAAWLIDKNHLTRASVMQALQQHFPDSDPSFL